MPGYAASGLYLFRDYVRCLEYISPWLLSKLGVPPPTVRALPGRLSALSVSLCKPVFYGAFVWARRALNSQKRRLPAPPGRLSEAELAPIREAVDQLEAQWVAQLDQAISRPMDR